jgi:hypothetical protein
MDKDTGGPAFPATNHHGHKLEGMSLRDYFAAKAMQGLLADPDWRQDTTFEDTAYAAYEQANAMLKARGQA